MQLVGVFASEELKNHAGEEEGQATADKADEGAREQWSKAYGSYGFDKPHHFIGSISEIVKKLPPGLQISRVRIHCKHTTHCMFMHALAVF